MLVNLDHLPKYGENFPVFNLGKKLKNWNHHLEDMVVFLKFHVYNRRTRPSSTDGTSHVVGAMFQEGRWQTNKAANQQHRGNLRVYMF